MLVISAGIRPRDELARESGITTGERGGIVVNDQLLTNDPDIYAIGEAVLHREKVYGLVAPGYEMAECVARSEEHTSELQSLMRISYAVFCLKKKKTNNPNKLDKHNNIKHNTKYVCKIDNYI